jgi:hypothetical protein
VFVDGLVGWEVVREVTPGDAGAVDLEDGVHEVAQAVLGKRRARPVGEGELVQAGAAGQDGCA